MLLTWIGFLVSLAGILIISRKNLAAGLISGALILGLFTLPVQSVFRQAIDTVSDPSIILLAIAMGLIPVLGGTMKESGQIDSLVNNVRLSRRYMLPFSAALMGLLPMPGGALLSAPIVERAGEGVSDELKAVINNWFRHLFILIYPLCSALIVSAEIAGLDVYQAIVYLLPAFFFALALGYIFFLRHVNGHPNRAQAFSWAGLAIPVVIILCAPLIDFSLKRLLSLGSLATLAGVSSGLLLSIGLSKRKLYLWRIMTGMRSWNFSLIIVGMFLYLHIFQQSDARSLIATLPLPPLMLAVCAGCLLGFVTGRVQLPASIILPVYLASVSSVEPEVFALIYVSIFFGYIISPVHPCLVVTCQYFHVPIRRMLVGLAAPTLLVVLVVLVLAWVLG